MEESPIVVDNGSGQIKAGFGGDDAPIAVFNNIIATTSAKDTLIGDESQARQDVIALEYPMERGIVTNWNSMETIWQHTFEKELKIQPQKQPILMTEVLLNPKRNREKMAEILFEKFDFPGVYIEIPTVLSTFGTGSTTGVTLDCGEGVSTCVALYEGSPIKSSIKRFDLAGRDITNFLSAALRERSVAESDRRLFSRDIKEELCYVAPDFQKELLVTAGLKNPKMEKEYKLPDGRTVFVGNERFRSTEILFQPPLFGQTIPGIQESLCQSIVDSGVDIKKKVLAHVAVTGGSTLFPGFVERITKGISESFIGEKIKVIAPPERKYSAFIGGSIIGSLSTFKEMVITKQKFNENGSSVVHNNNYLEMEKNLLVDNGS